MSTICRIYIVSLLCILLTSVKINAQLRINEVLSSNITVNYNHKFNLVDWIELYNSGSGTVNLNGYYLSDDRVNLFKYRIDKDVYIYPGNYILIYADELNFISADNIHTNFSLSIEGEFISILDNDGNLIDSVSMPLQIQDISYGRNIEDPLVWNYFEQPTPKELNYTTGYINYSTSGEINFSLSPGFFDTPVTIELQNEDNAEIRYTTNGNYPTKSSTLYSSALYITKSTVIRARSFKEGTLPGKVVSATYFINEPEYNIPVVSLTTDEENFYDNTIGIYVTGTNGITGNCASEPKNWNQNWERPANFELFDTGRIQQLNQLAGIKIYGQCSRQRNLKSMAVISRKDYGKRGFDYRFFSDKPGNYYKSIILRNSGNDAGYSFLRDGFFQTVFKDQLDIDYQAYQPVIVYLNGEYFGLMNLREKINEHYVESNYGIDSDEIDMLEKKSLLMHGESSDYGELFSFISTHNLADEQNFTYVESQMDINEFSNYYIVNIFFGNMDWPGNNIKYWHHRTSDSKWRWITFDMDVGANLYGKTGSLVSYSIRDGEWSTEIMRSLLENNDFKNQFIQKFATHISLSFQKERMIYIFDSLRAIIEPHIQKNCDIWRIPYNIYEWRDHVNNVIPEFIQTRQNEVRGWIMQDFDLDGTYTASLNVEGEMGRIILYNKEIRKNVTVEFFKNIPVKLKAVPQVGYKFLKWSGDIECTEEEIIINSSENISVNSIFVPGEPVENLYFSELLASNESTFGDEYHQKEDWIEIYNNNHYDVNIAGLFITDSTGDLNKWQIPCGFSSQTIIPAKDYITLFADNETQQGPMHLPFKLNKQGEVLIISQNINDQIQIIDSLIFQKQYTDVTYGIDPDDESKYCYLIPTPGKPNQKLMINDIVINEVMASNNSTITDNKGEYDDWIEIYNLSDSAVNIGGLFITDSLNNKIKFRIPNTCSDSTKIPAKDYLILWADNQPEQGIHHLNFKLNRQNEELAIVQPDGINLIDHYNINNLNQDVAMGRFPDGENNIHLLNPTPGLSNEYTPVRNILITEVSATRNDSITSESGEVTDWIELFNNNDYDVNIGGLFLTDSLKEKCKYRIPANNIMKTTIPAKEYIILWADNEPEQGELHLNFRLNGDGEQIGLIDLDGKTFIDSLTFENQFANFTYNRIDNTGKWMHMRPTPYSMCHNQMITGLQINEFMADNDNMVPDEIGNYYDWIEIYNTNNYPVDLGGLYFTDSIKNPFRYRFPSNEPELTTISAKGYKVIYANNGSGQGPLYTNFKLDKSGEEIGIFNYDRKTKIDIHKFSKQPSNTACAKLHNDNEWYYLPPTPGEANILPVIENLYINEFMTDNEDYLSDENGEFDDWIELYNGNDHPVNIGGLFFTDSLSNSTLFRIPAKYPDSTTIMPDSFILLWADGEPEQGILHLDFKLNKNKEQIGIYDWTGKNVIDSISYNGIPLQKTYGRIYDGSSHWSVLENRTPNYSNLITSAENHISDVESLFVYPNPWNDKITFELKLKHESDLRFSIINIQGEILYDQNLPSDTQFIIDWNGTINGSTINHGLYYYRIITKDSLITGKILKYQN